MALASIPTKQYIGWQGNGYCIRGTRISLDSVVYAFLDGETPEIIAQNFPLLSLEQVYGAITFYLAHRDVVDAYLQNGEADFQRLQEACRERNPDLYQTLMVDQAGLSQAS